MKKIIIPISALFVAGFSHAQTLNLSTNENYVYTKTYLTDPTGPTPKSVESVQYLDGLGRPKQAVNIKASPLGRDVVTHFTYDQYGRQAMDYLPVPQSGTGNGAIVTSPLTNATQADIYGSEIIFSKKEFESSPLDRVLEQRQVGTAWSSKPVKFDYEANENGEVKKYVATFDYASFSSAITLSPTPYGAGQLYKNTVTDEDGNKTIEFKNSQGQVVLVRKMLDATTEADTYYVYNDYNQLAYVIPPLAVAANAVDTTTLNNLCYQYKYDSRNRLVEKKLPGKGWEFMVYDKQDRLVGSQDSNLAEKGQWLFTKYDRFGRVAFTGISTGGDRLTEQADADLKGSNNMNRIESSGFMHEGMEVFYSGRAYPSDSKYVKILSINYYDTYASYSFNPAFPSTVFGVAVISDNSTGNSVSTKSLPVMTLIKNIEDDNWTKNYTWYDSRGRALATHSVNHLGGYTKTESELDFSGTPQTVVTRHKRLNTDTERVITENFTYDHQNRLLTHTHQVDGNAVEYLAQNKYNELSQLESKKVGGVSANSPLQQMDYKYNIRGWMTGINNPNDLSGGDLFGYEIKYNNPENTGLTTGRFNGNIAEIDWKTSTVVNDSKRRYSYVYDGLNRLSQGIYTEPGSSILNNNNYNEYLTYDLNGNIKTLQRYSKPTTGITAEQIDDLVYNYTGNRLDQITLPPGVSNNYSGYNALGGAFAYDSNGNMKSHGDKGIGSIGYNHLSLPNTLTVGSGIKKSQVNYVYRADGTKLMKTTGGGASLSGSTTDYLDGFQYLFNNDFIICIGCPAPTIGPELQFVPTSEGYYDFVKNKYIYNYADHLGNTRLSYFHNGSSIEVLEENNYYPFGLKHEGYNQLSGNPGYQYKYNGKELQNETGMYDYGARFYMPDIGRWGVVDQLAEKMTRHSPYNYAFNNPIRFIDPDGRQGTDWVGKTDATGSTQWHWEDKIKSASQASAAGYDSYSDGKTNNTYTSTSGSEVTLKTEGNWSEDFTNVNRERLGAAEAKMFGKYASGISITGSYGNTNQTISLAANWGTGQFKIFHTAGLKIGPESPGDIGFSVFQMSAYGEKDGAKYTNVFEGATGYSTEFSGSYVFGGSHGFSASDNSISRADYGTQATSFNIGTGYDAGVSRTYTTDITQKVNNAPSVIGNWLRKNIRHSPQFD